MANEHFDLTPEQKATLCRLYIEFEEHPTGDCHEKLVSMGLVFVTQIAPGRYRYTFNSLYADYVAYGL